MPTSERTDAPSPGEQAREPRRRGALLPYFPGLDGLRAVAVIAVLLFHADFSWAKGGFLGVSTFFTLSGFLITALLLAERGATGGISLRAFWARRFRRLMPAAFAAIGVAIVFAVLAGDPSQQRNLAGDVGATLLYVANWRFILSGQSYAALFTTEPSPLLQFWSLAIEEQFYLLYPLLAYWLLHVRVVTRRAFAAVLGGLLALSVALTLFGGFSIDRIYYGTDTRAAELLVGGLLACVFYDRRVTHRLATDAVVQRWFAALGAGALAVCAALWVVASRDGAIVRGGWLTGYAVLSALVIVAAVVPMGPVRLVLGVAPLRWLGVVSYGVYLYHWPIFLWLSEDRTGLTPVPLLGVRVAATLAAATLSYKLLELPIRHGARIARVTPIRVAPIVATALLLAAIVVTRDAPPPRIDFAAAQRQLAATTQSNVPLKETAAGQPPFPRLAMFGDSTAMLTGFGLNDWARKNPDKADFVGSNTLLGCGVGRGGERRDGTVQGEIAAQCNDWAITWAQTVRTSKPTIAVVQVGPWEVADRKLEGDDTWRALGDPIYDDYLANEMTSAVDVLSKEGATVIWLTSPQFGDGSDGGKEKKKRGQAADPARMDRLNEIIRTLPGLRPGKVGVVDLATWLAASGLDDGGLRPDGVHFSPDGSFRVADAYLATAVIDEANRIWTEKNTLKDDASQITAPPTTAAGSTTTPTYSPTARKLLVVGDDAAASLVAPLTDWSQRNGGAAIVTNASIPGCGLTRSARRDNRGTLEDEPGACANAFGSWTAAVKNDKPDMVVVAFAEWEVTDHVFAGDTNRYGPGSAAYETKFGQSAAQLIDAASAAGSRVMWVAWPHIDVGTGKVASDPQRMDRLNAVVNVVLNTRRTSSTFIDFAAQASTWPNGELDPDYRPDGVGIGGRGATAAMDWLGGELFSRFADAQR